jgi:riboflavin kinase/FMN adenylyltransferase
VVVRFTPAFAAAPASRFARHELVECLGARRVFIGFNFSFGRQGEGTPERLSELGRRFGFDVVVLPAVVSDGRVVSSSAARKAVMAGEMETATAMLGRPYSLHGTIVHGDARGRRLGFPTANVALAHDLVCPRTGVYLTRVRWQDETAFGVANFGQRPTFAGRETRLEVHLLDRSDDWYGRQVAVEFIHLLRGERQFRDADELSAQIAADVAIARSLIAANGDGGLQAAATVVE